MQYRAKSGSGYSQKDAEVIGPELERLAADGRASAPEIVKAAAPDEAPLHPYFEWDDPEAARLYRETQARHIARSVVVVRVTNRPDGSQREEEIRAFHAVAVDRSEEEPEQKAEPRQYLSVDVVRGDRALASQVVAQAHREMLGWRKRYLLYMEDLIRLNPAYAQVFQFTEQLTFDLNPAMTEEAA